MRDILQIIPQDITAYRLQSYQYPNFAEVHGHDTSHACRDEIRHCTEYN